MMERFISNIKKNYKVPIVNHELITWKLMEIRKSDHEREKSKPQPQGEQRDRVVVRTDLLKVQPAEGEMLDVIRKILIEGCTGIGKTALCMSYCCDWANGELLEQFKLVLFLPLGDKGVQSASSVYEVLRIVYPDETEEACTSVASYMEQTEGKDVLVIADGWNEVDECERLSKKAFLNNLLFGTKYPFLSIMLTSRLSASDQLRGLSCIDKIIKICSLNREDIRAGIALEFSKEKDKACHLLEQLENNPLIENVCSVPVDYTLVCHLCHTLQEITLPTTMTALYLMMMKQGVFNDYSGITPSEMRQPSQLLCETAFKAIKNNQTLFSQQELTTFHPQNTALKQVATFELIQSSESIISIGRFRFISSTIQGYLASLYLVRQAQAPDTLLNLIKQHAISEKFDIVWRFFFGIYSEYYHEQTDLIKQAAQLLFSIQSKHKKFLQLCHCAFEARNAIVTNKVVKTLKDMNSPHSGVFFGDPSTAYDCAAIIYVISNIEMHCLIELNLKNCLRESQLKELQIALIAKTGIVSIKTLDLSSNGLSDQGIRDLFHRAPAVFESLEKLFLNCNQIENEAVSAIVLALSKSSSHTLKLFDLSFNPLTTSALKELQDAVYSGILENLEILFLRRSLTEDVEVNLQFLSDFVRGLTSNCKYLRRLNLSANDLGKSGSPIIKEIISQLLGLRKDFDLCLNQEYMSDVDNNFIEIMEESIRQKGSIDHTIVHGVFVGPGRSGKNSLMNRLIGEGPLDPNSISPSTGVLENIIKVEVKKLCTVATAANSDSLIWRKLDYDEEAIELMMTTTKSHFQTAQSCSFQNKKNEATSQNTIIGKHSITESDTICMSDNVKKLRLDYSSKGSNVQVSDKEGQQSSSEVMAACNMSAVPSTHLTPLDMFKHALKARQLDALREYLESSWSLYLTNTGGQMEFQELLPLLVSGPSVFFIVFPLNKSLKEHYIAQYQYADGSVTDNQSSCTLMDEILQILATIATLDYTGPDYSANVRPKVFFIGTYKDQLPLSTAERNIQDIDRQLREMVKRTTLYQQGSIEFAKPMDSEQLIFTVSNLANSDDDFQKIRLALQQAVDRFNEFTIRCPSSWLVLSLILRSKHKSSQVLSYNECFKIAKECGISNQAEFNGALSFVHARLGLIRYFAIKDLNTIVITDPQILFDIITKLMVETFTNEYAEVNEIEEFQRKGMLSMEAIERISKNEKFKSDLIPFPWLLNLLDHQRIAAIFLNAEGEKKCFFPCALCHAPKQEPISHLSKCAVPPILIAFKTGYCPRGISGALIKYLMTNEMKSEIPWHILPHKIFRNQVSFSVGVNDIIFKVHPTHLEVCLDPQCDSRVRETCREAYKQIQQAMKVVTKGYINCGYQFAFYCTRTECNINQHPAIIDLQNEMLKCKITGGQSYLPSLYDIWIAEKIDTNHQKLKEEIDEVHLGQIADSMYEWEGSVAEHLGLTTVDINAIKEEHRHKLRLQTRAALTLWKKKFGSKATYSELIHVFEIAGYQNFADTVKETVRYMKHNSNNCEMMDDSLSTGDVCAETLMKPHHIPHTPTDPSLHSPSTAVVIAKKDSSELEEVEDMDVSVHNEQKYMDIFTLTDSNEAGAMMLFPKQSQQTMQEMDFVDGETSHDKERGENISFNAIELLDGNTAVTGDTAVTEDTAVTGDTSVTGDTVVTEDAAVTEDTAAHYNPPSDPWLHLIRNTDHKCWLCGELHSIHLCYTSDSPVGSATVDPNPMTMQFVYISYHLIRRYLRRINVHMSDILQCPTYSQDATAAIKERAFQEAVRAIEAAYDETVYNTAVLLNESTVTIQQLVQSIDISDGQLHSEFVKVANVMVHSSKEIDWKQIIFLLYFTSLLVERLIKEKLASKVDRVVMWLAKHLYDHVLYWIEQKRGWGAVAGALHTPDSHQRWRLGLAALGVGAIIVALMTLL